jgi:hypothetical protein
MFKFKSSAGLPRHSSAEAGQASRLLLVLAVVVLVAVIIVYLVMKMAEKPPAPPPPTGQEIILPVYEQVLGNIKFIYESALDKGNVLRASEIQNIQYISSTQKNLTTGEKFIKVTIGAQNTGTKNIEQNSWGMGNIIDSEGRNFEPLEGYTISPWLPNPDLCGTLLKPAFAPTPCTKIYEVSKASTGFKINIMTGKDNLANNFSSNKSESALIDLIVK